jgi:hypothetical protein
MAGRSFAGALFIFGNGAPERNRMHGAGEYETNQEYLQDL